MEDFAKLFVNKEHGQIVVLLDRDSEGNPQVKYFVQPKGLGVCMVGPSYSDDEEGWDKAEACFAKSDEAFALTILKPIFMMAEDAANEEGTTNETA